MLGVVLGKLYFLPFAEMLAAQVLVCQSVGLKCWKFCWESCANTLYASTIFPCSLQTSWLLRYLCACLSVGLKCWKFCECWMRRYLCACLSVGLKCWKFCCWKSCANTQYAIPSFRQVGRPGTCVPAYRLG